MMFAYLLEFFLFFYIHLFTYYDDYDDGRPFLFRYVDAVLTIPKGTLFPMCGMNLAFDRELIGPGMYFGLMGDGQPIGRYDDMWAGWCVKVHTYISVSLHFVSNSMVIDLVFLAL